MIKKVAVVFMVFCSLFVSLYIYFDYLNRSGFEKISWAKSYVDYRQEVANKNEYSKDGFEIVSDYMVPAVLGDLENDHVKYLIDNHCIDYNSKCAQINLVLASMFLGKNIRMFHGAFENPKIR